MKPQLRAILMATPSITAKVGSRIDWDWRNIGAPLPAITLSLPSRMSDPTLDGMGPIEARVRIDCWAATAKAAEELSAAVMLKFDGYRDSFFQGFFFAGDRTLPETDGVTTVHRVSMDFTTTYHFNG